MNTFTSSDVATGLVLGWDEAVAAGPAAAGGKGWNLGRLVRYGLPVPDGFVLGAAAYAAHMKEAGLEGDAAALEERLRAEGAAAEGVEAALGALREHITQAPLPPAVLTALRSGLAGVGDGPLAIRSSATAEDAAVASFAGMHGTLLNVRPTAEDVARAVAACYASMWTAHAVAYRHRHGLDGVAMAVVVMRLVPAVAAGVAFTADPRTGRRDQVIVTANRGLGESVVSGAVDPDEYTVEGFIDRPPAVVSRRIGRKERRTEALSAREGGGTRLVEVPTAGAAEAVLTDARALEIAALALRCQDALGEDYAPQDVEWADDGERLWVVQSRPITALPEPLPDALRGQPVIWSTANLKEVIAPVPSPFSWATIRLTVRELLESTVRRAKYRCPPGLRWARLYRGHPYFNLSLMQWMFYDAFGIAPARVNQLLGGQQPEIRVPPGNAFLGRGGWRRLRGVVGQIADAGRAAAEIARACEEASAAVRRVLATDVTAKTDPQVLDDFYAMGAVYLRFMPEFMRANSQAASWLDNLGKTLERLLPGRGNALATRLLAGTGGIASAEQGYRLAELARVAGADPAARAFFLRAQSLPRPNDLAGPVEEWVRDAGVPLATEWPRALEGTAAGQAMARFLEEFGHRGVDELEIAQPRWAEDPSYVVETVRHHILSGLEAPPEHAAAAARAQAEREVAAGLRFHPLRPLVGWMVGQARRASALRENSKSVLVLTMTPPRRGALELARRLEARGVLRSPEDVFYLTSTELVSLVDGSWPGDGAQRLVDDRRLRNRRSYEGGAPDVVLDDQPVVASHRPAEVDATGETFVGLGVAAGTARGAARIIRHPRDGAALQKGEVLVAPTTDPGWTPLFLRAAGLVMETGGYLSHGAIVAREYGIPAVANLPGVLDTLRDGDPLVVDGNTGRVTRQKAPPHG